MQKRQKAKEIIRILEDRGFYAECPCCEEPVRLSKCGLFYLDNFTKEAKKVYEALRLGLDERSVELKKRRKEISAESELGAKSVNLGFILERLAPAMEGFRFERNDCRSLFDPIDYVIFEGLSRRGTVGRIIFSDIKTGGSPLTPSQREIRRLVEAKKVSIVKYKAEE